MGSCFRKPPRLQPVEKIIPPTTVHYGLYDTICGIDWMVPNEQLIKNCDYLLGELTRNGCNIYSICGCECIAFIILMEFLNQSIYTGIIYAQKLKIIVSRLGLAHCVSTYCLCARYLLSHYVTDNFNNQYVNYYFSDAGGSANSIRDMGFADLLTRMNDPHALSMAQELSRIIVEQTQLYGVPQPSAP